MPRMFRDPIHICEAIRSALRAAAQPGWDRIDVEARFDGGRIDVVASCRKAGSDQPTEVLADVPLLASHFHDLDQAVGGPGTARVKRFNYVLRPDGGFKFDFEY